MTNLEVRPRPLPVGVERQLVLRDGREGRVLRPESGPVGGIDGRVLLFDPDDRRDDGRLRPDVLPLDDHLLRPLCDLVRVQDGLQDIVTNKVRLNSTFCEKLKRVIQLKCRDKKWVFC